MAASLVPILQALACLFLGALVGGMTSASGLAAAGTLSSTNYAPAAYATVYPVALIGKILAVKILLLLL